MPSDPSDKPAKSASAFRTISEVATDLDLPQHVLRFWESKFPQVRPLKRGGGRRYYRPEDVQLLRRIRDLLYVDGYTIKGVQKLMRQSGSVRAFADETTLMPTDASQTSSSENSVGPILASGPDLDPVINDLTVLRNRLLEALS